MVIPTNPTHMPDTEETTTSTSTSPPDAARDERYVLASLGIIVCFMLFEVAAGLVSHSLALLADAGHMLTDAGSILAALAALRLARRPAGGAWTFGLKRAEVLSAQANGITLGVIAALVAFEAVLRLVHPSGVSGGIVVVAAGIGLVANAAATWCMRRARRDSMGIKGALQHIVTDLFAFLATLVAGVVIVTTGQHRADSIASLVVVVLMVRASWVLLSETGRVLLEAAPAGYEPDAIAEDMVANPEVESVHDVHLWLISSGFAALSAHVLVKRPADCHQVRRDLESMLEQRYDLVHTTLQVDHAPEKFLEMGPTARHRSTGPP